MRRQKKIAAVDSFDSDLNAWYASGDEASFARLYHKCKPLLVKAALNHLSQQTPGRMESVEEVVQDVMTEVFRSRGKDSAWSNRQGSQARTWLWTLARNKCVDRLRGKQYRERSVSDIRISDASGGAESLDFFEQLVPDQASGDVLELIVNNEQRATYEAALQQLPPASRRLVTDVLNRKPYKLIAAELGCGKSAVSKRLKKIVAVLQAKCGD